MSMNLKPVNLTHKLGKFSDHWSPKIIAQMDDYQFKLAKFEGEFVWHKHADTDEVFIVLDGSMTIHFHDGEVTVRAGELFVVPHGIEHKTSAQVECKALIVEKAGTLNTGDVSGELTSPTDSWI
jgi:mannose-6-phosphate isomerase-like protein (cupin superfamily)